MGAGLGGLARRSFQFGGSSNANTTTNTSSPPPQTLADYQGVVNRGTAVANTPYTPYPGEQVAPLSNQTNTGLANVNQYAYAAQPYIAQAGQYVQQGAGMQGQAGQYQQTGAGLVNQGSGMIPQAGNMTLQAAGAVSPTSYSGQALGQFMNPYTADVVQQTQNEFNNQNTQQAQFLNSQNIGAGAFGGDRAGISQAVLAGQQQASQAPVIAGLNQNNFNQALAEFNNQQQTGLGAQEFNKQQLGQMGAQYANLGSTLGNMGGQLGNIGQQYGNTGVNLGNLGGQYGAVGTAAQTTGLQGAGAQVQYGGVPQAEQQNIDTTLQNDFTAAQAYPFQNTEFLSNLIEGIGSQTGGTASTTTPAPSLGSQLLGLGTTGAGIASNLFGSTAGGTSAASNIGAGLSSLFAGLATGGRVKENVTPIGKTFDGQTIHKYNFKGDPRPQIGVERGGFQGGGNVSPGSVYDLGVGKGFSPSGALALMDPSSGAGTGTGRFGAGSLSMTPGHTTFSSGSVPVIPGGEQLSSPISGGPSPTNPLSAGPARQPSTPYTRGMPGPVMRPTPGQVMMARGGRAGFEIGGATGLGGNIQMTDIPNTPFVDFATPIAIAQGTGVPDATSGIANIEFSNATGTNSGAGSQNSTVVGSSNLSPSQPNLAGAPPGTTYAPIDYQDPSNDFQTAGAEGSLGPHWFTTGKNGELVYGGEGTAPAGTPNPTNQGPLLPRPGGNQPGDTPKTENPPPAAPPPAPAPAPAKPAPVAPPTVVYVTQPADQVRSWGGPGAGSSGGAAAGAGAGGSGTGGGGGGEWTGGRIGRDNGGGLGGLDDPRYSYYTPQTGNARGAHYNAPTPPPPTPLPPVRPPAPRPVARRAPPARVPLPPPRPLTPAPQPTANAAPPMPLPGLDQFPQPPNQQFTAPRSVIDPTAGTNGGGINPPIYHSLFPTMGGPRGYAGSDAPAQPQPQMARFPSSADLARIGIGPSAGFDPITGARASLRRGDDQPGPSWEGIDRPGFYLGGANAGGANAGMMGQWPLAGATGFTPQGQGVTGFDSQGAGMGAGQVAKKASGFDGLFGGGFLRGGRVGFQDGGLSGLGIEPTVAPIALNILAGLQPVKMGNTIPKAPEVKPKSDQADPTKGLGDSLTKLSQGLGGGVTAADFAGGMDFSDIGGVPNLSDSDFAGLSDSDLGFGLGGIVRPRRSFQDGGGDGDGDGGASATAGANASANTGNTSAGEGVTSSVGTGHGSDSVNTTNTGGQTAVTGGLATGFNATDMGHVSAANTSGSSGGPGSPGAGNSNVSGRGGGPSGTGVSGAANSGGQLGVTVAQVMNTIQNYLKAGLISPAQAADLTNNASGVSGLSDQTYQNLKSSLKAGLTSPGTGSGAEGVNTAGLGGGGGGVAGNGGGGAGGGGGSGGVGSDAVAGGTAGASTGSPGLSPAVVALINSLMDKYNSSHGGDPGPGHAPGTVAVGSPGTGAPPGAVVTVTNPGNGGAPGGAPGGGGTAGPPGTAPRGLGTPGLGTGTGVAAAPPGVVAAPPGSSDVTGAEQTGGGAGHIVQADLAGGQHLYRGGRASFGLGGIARRGFLDGGPGPPDPPQPPEPAPLPVAAPAPASQAISAATAPKFDASGFPTNRADASPGQREAFGRAYAKSIGYDPDRVAGVGRSEGYGAPGAGPSTVDIENGKPFSFGDYQLNTKAGVGVDALKAGIDPRDPNQWQAADKFAIDTMAKGGLGPWKGDAYVKGLGGGGGGSALAFTGGGGGEQNQQQSQAGYQAALDDAARPPDRKQLGPGIGDTLIMMGARMMAGTSPHPLVNIGQGIEAGMEYAQKQRGLDNEWRKNDAQIQDFQSQAKYRDALTNVSVQNLNLERYKYINDANMSDWVLGGMQGPPPKWLVPPGMSIPSGASNAPAPTVSTAAPAPGGPKVSAAPPPAVSVAAPAPAEAPVTTGNQPPIPVTPGALVTAGKPGGATPVATAAATPPDQAKPPGEAPAAPSDTVGTTGVPDYTKDPEYQQGAKMVMQGNALKDRSPAASAALISKGQQLMDGAKNRADIQKEPILAREKAVGEAAGKEEGEIDTQMVARQSTNQTLTRMKQLMQQPGFTTGEFADQKAKLTAALVSAFGSDAVSASALAQAQNVQEFNKDAMNLIMQKAKDTGGRILASEIETIRRGMPSTSLTPGAVAAMINQIQGVLKWQDDHDNALLDWRDTHPADNPAKFERTWTMKKDANGNLPNSPEAYVAKARKNFPYEHDMDNQTPASLEDGHAYMTKTGPLRWNAQKQRFFPYVPEQ